MNITIGVVAYNEEHYLYGLLKDFVKQTYDHKKIEILLIDSMSTDYTKSIMREFQAKYAEEFLDIRVLKNKGKIQAAGWNVAIDAFTTDALIRIDAHAHIPKDFVEANVKCLESGENVCGGVRPTICEDGKGFTKTLHMAEESMFGSSIANFRRKDEDGEADKEYVKSIFHACYRREVFDRVGKFREDLGRTEDNEFHKRVRDKGYTICKSKDIHSYQFIRPTFTKMIKQKYGNGYWVGKTLKLAPKCLSAYHLVPGGFVAGIILSTIMALLGKVFTKRKVLLTLPAILLWTLYIGTAVFMSICAVKDAGEKSGKKLGKSKYLLPLVFFALHVAYGVGTLIGIKDGFTKED